MKRFLGWLWRTTNRISKWVLFVLAVIIGFNTSVDLMAFLEKPVTCNESGPLATWVAHEWVGDAKRNQEYIDFAERLQHYGVTDIFVHSGPLTGSGLIHPVRYQYAAPFIQTVKEVYPDLMIHAWIGQREARGGGPLDISSVQTRANIAKTSQKLLALGFDGIHVNIEPIEDGNADFLQLLDDLNSLTTSLEKELSVAAYEISTGFRDLTREAIGFDSYWSVTYAAQVFERINLAAIMSYDTSSLTPWGYAGRMQRISISIFSGSYEHISYQSQAASNTKLLIGIPTYDELTPWHLPWAENATSAIKGLCPTGISFGFDRNGFAVYADWTTSPEEWAIITGRK